MSKAFTKDDADDSPVVVAPRAHLPEGVVNYVTPRGAQALREELATLLARRATVGEASIDGGDGPSADRTREAAALAGRVRDLEQRIASAVVVEPSGHADRVRFGATVVVRAESGEARRYTIVGVDEADAANGRIAFLSPIARALLGKAEGDAVVVRSPRGEEELTIESVRYDDR